MATPARREPGPAASASTPPLQLREGRAGQRRVGSHRKLNSLQQAGQRRRSRKAAKRERRAARRYWFGRHPVASGWLVLVLLLTPIWVSVGGALGNPSYGTSVSSRFAEWMRDHGGGPVVIWAENLWYSHHQPAVGGTPPKGLIPPPTASSHGTSPSAALAEPAAIIPLASPPIAGEGQWHPVGRLVHGTPAIYEAFLRPDALHTSLVVGVAWMDTKLLKATLYSGSMIPGGGPYRYTAPVQPDAAKTLVAAFNAGFRMGDANGGYYTQGKTIVPLRSGAASVVINADGSIQLGAWGRDVHMTPNVVSVRQNLNLLVDGGRPVPGLNANDTTQWGVTLGNKVYVWRSGLGITANGALVYVGGPGLNITTLADLLVRAGAVRGMELDINTDWVNFVSFTPSTPTGLATTVNGKDLLANMNGDPSRYFASWWARDFFTLSAR